LTIDITNTSNMGRHAEGHRWQASKHQRNKVAKSVGDAVLVGGSSAGDSTVVVLYREVALTLMVGGSGHEARMAELIDCAECLGMAIVASYVDTMEPIVRALNECQ
jgi:hypothetical protein